jgi:arsenical pump membrane protein
VWPPFVLVAALLAIGQVAHSAGLFELASTRLARMPGPPAVLLLACLALVALVTAVLNLDTAAVFMTPVLIATARRRGLEVAPFLYGAVFMANASSLFLPGSNLTNLLVLHGAGAHAISGGAFLSRMLSLSLPACALTATGLLLWHRRALTSVEPQTGRQPSHEGEPVLRLQASLGCLAAALLIVLLGDPALPVLGVALVLLAFGAFRGWLGLREVVGRLGLPSLCALFLLALALGTLARSGGFPESLLHGAGGPLTAMVAALASVVVNNLPAAVLLSARGHPDAGALLLGLNVGPNLAVTGSLSALLWWRAARSVGVRPSALAYSRHGIVLSVLAIAGALLVRG